jgi:hypothetical protein
MKISFVRLPSFERQYESKEQNVIHLTDLRGVLSAAHLSKVPAREAAEHLSPTGCCRIHPACAGSFPASQKQYTIKNTVCQVPVEIAEKKASGARKRI